MMEVADKQIADIESQIDFIKETQLSEQKVDQIFKDNIASLKLAK